MSVDEPGGVYTDCRVPRRAIVEGSGPLARSCGGSVCARNNRAGRCFARARVNRGGVDLTAVLGVIRHVDLAPARRYSGLLRGIRNRLYRGL